MSGREIEPERPIVERRYDEPMGEAERLRSMLYTAYWEVAFGGGSEKCWATIIDDLLAQGAKL